MNGYLCFYNGRKCEVHATSSYDAQRQAAEKMNVKPNKRYLIEVCLVEKEGAPVEFSTQQLPGA